jgi:hypothetical protein
MIHGTYDRSGVFHPQKVHLGVTHGGRCGLFTGGRLAWPLTDEKHDAFVKDKAALIAYVERMGFTFEEAPAASQP